MKKIFFIIGILGLFFSLFIQDFQLIDIGQEIESKIFWEIRFPRLVLTLICGSCLSIVGLYFQSLFRNDLASPYTLGIASASSFGVTLVIWLGLTSSLSLGPFIFDFVTLGAILGAMMGVLIIFSLARMRQNYSAHFLILAGVVISFIFSSLIMLFQFLSHEMGLQRMVYWLMGDLNIVGLKSLSLVIPFSIIMIGYSFSKRDVVNILSMGDRFARSKGIIVDRERKELFILLSLWVAFVVSLCGPIGFVGLVIPHIAKERFGANLRDSFFPSLWGGAFFLVWCEYITRCLSTNVMIPVGVYTSIFGGSYFLYLLLKKTNHNN